MGFGTAMSFEIAIVHARTYGYAVRRALWPVDAVADDVGVNFPFVTNDVFWTLHTADGRAIDYFPTPEDMAASDWEWA